MNIREEIASRSKGRVLLGSRLKMDEADVAICRKRRVGEACDAHHDPVSVCRHCYGTDVVGGWEGPRDGTARRIVVSYDSENWHSCAFSLPFTAPVAPWDLVLLGREWWTIAHVQSNIDLSEGLPEGWRVDARRLDEFEPGMQFLRDRGAGL